MKSYIDCTGDVVVGDRIQFEEAVFGGSRRRPKILGTRTIEADVVADSYGEAKQQHTFSLVVRASNGFKPLDTGVRIRRKGRNVYRRGAVRARWNDEAARVAVAKEKHARGDAARVARGVRKAFEDSW